MSPKRKKSFPVAKRLILKNTGAYSTPFSGVATEHAPLHSANNYHGIVLHECGYLHECKGWNFQSVFSPFWRMYYNSKSGHSIKLGDERIPLGPERLVLIPPFCIFHCEGVEPVPHFWMHFTYKKSLGVKMPTHLELAPGVAEMSLIQQLQSLHENAPSENNLLLGLALLHIILSRKELPWMSEHPNSLQKAMRFIDSHFRSDLVIGDVAKVAGLSASGLTRLFKKYLGMNPVRYVLDTRIREATTLLQQTEESIDDIAEKSGFSNRYYFTRMFKKITGQSPAGFRKEHFLKYSATNRPTRS